MMPAVLNTTEVVGTSVTPAKAVPNADVTGIADPALITATMDASTIWPARRVSWTD
jgi:hypothetical protein